MPGPHTFAKVSKDATLRKKLAGMTAAQLFKTMRAPDTASAQNHSSKLAGNHPTRTTLETPGISSRDPIIGITMDPGKLEMIRATVAQQLIMKNWMALGGPSSQVGLPLDTDFPVTKTTEDYRTDFRGGGLHFNTILI